MHRPDNTGGLRKILKTLINELNNAIYTHPESHAGTMITIADAGGYFTGTTTEAALQEIGATLDGLDAALEALL